MLFSFFISIASTTEQFHRRCWRLHFGFADALLGFSWQVPGILLLFGTGTCAFACLSSVEQRPAGGLAGAGRTCSVTCISILRVTRMPRLLRFLRACALFSPSSAIRCTCCAYSSRTISLIPCNLAWKITRVPTVPAAFPPRTPPPCLPAPVVCGFWLWFLRLRAYFLLVLTLRTVSSVVNVARFIFLPSH